MPRALAKPAAPVAPAEWVTIAEAAARTGLSERAWRFRAAGLEKRGEAVQCADGWRIKTTALPPAPAGMDAPPDRASLVEQFGPEKAQGAWTRKKWLDEWRRACAQDRSRTSLQHAARVVAEAKRAEGADFAITARTLQNWAASFRREGLAGLIDGRGQNAAGGGTHAPRDAAALEYFYSLYHTQSRLSVKRCHKVTLAKAVREGWTWPASYAATFKFLQKNDDFSLSCLLREGKSEWSRRYLPHVEIDYSKIEPGEMYVADHHECDFWVEQGGKQFRPWLTAVQDMRSRCIVGWNLGAAPHSDAILAAMHSAFQSWAIPKTMRIDNGKDFVCATITGLTRRTRDALRREHGADFWRVLERDKNLVQCAADPRFKGVVGELGVDLIFATPYAPWSKGTIERFFGTFADQCAKSFITYCGNNALKKPECLNAIRKGYTSEQKYALRKKHGKFWKKVAVLKLVDQRAIPSLAEARRAVGEWIELYHSSAHSAHDLFAPTPLAVWQTATTLRRAKAEELLLLTQCRGIYRVTANGVALTVGAAKIRYGAGHPALQRFIGRDVAVCVAPDDAGRVHVFTPESPRKFIATLTANQRIAPNATVEEVREAVHAVQKRRKIMHAAARSAPQRTRSVAQELTANRAEELAALRKTGTCDAAVVPNIAPVQTGFEGASIPPQNPVELPEFDPADWPVEEFAAKKDEFPEYEPMQFAPETKDDFGDWVDRLPPLAAAPSPDDDDSPFKNFINE